jgi:hypothetical protein
LRVIGRWEEYGAAERWVLGELGFLGAGNSAGALGRRDGLCKEDFLPRLLAKTWKTRERFLESRRPPTKRC